MSKKYRSDAMAAIHETAEACTKLGPSINRRCGVSIMPAHADPAIET